MFVQLLKAYGLTEQSCVVFADTGSCGNTTELTQSVLWDLAASFNVLLSMRRCVWLCMICTCPHVPACERFVFVVFECMQSTEHASFRAFMCLNRLVPLSTGP